MEQLALVLLGFVLERVFGILRAMMFPTVRSRLRGQYEVWNPAGERNGIVTITPKLGNRFLTHGSQPSGRDWNGSFRLDGLFMDSGNGAYRHLDYQDNPAPDWGAHYLMVLPGGDISVQWHNFSGAEDNKGWVIWKRVQGGATR